MKKLLLILGFWLAGLGPVWANGHPSETKIQWGFSLISGLILGALLLGTAAAGHLFLKRKVSRQVHHLAAYSTLLWALVHGIYNIFFH